MIVVVPGCVEVVSKDLNKEGEDTESVVDKRLEVAVVGQLPLQVCLCSEIELNQLELNRPN